MGLAPASLEIMSQTLTHRKHRPLDALGTFDTFTRVSRPASGTLTVSAPARYSIRQALDQEHHKHILKLNNEARQARYSAGGTIPTNSSQAPDSSSANGDPTQPATASVAAEKVKLDFFGRPIATSRQSSSRGSSSKLAPGDDIDAEAGEKGGKVWVSYHEGFSNAVRKPITMEELMRGFTA